MSRANTIELLGNAALVRNVRSKLMLCDKLYRMRVDKESLNIDFLNYVFASNLSRYQFERDATGASASMKNIGQDTIKDLLIPRPSVTEQQEIVAALDTQCNYLNIIINKGNKSIVFLREYRIALISAAVTGKIDVRKN